MNIYQIRDLALRILGIYYLSNALVYVFQVASLFSMDNNPTLAGNKLAITLSVLVPLVFWLLIGLLLTFRTVHVSKFLWPSSDEPEGSTIAKPSLRYWIVLIGLFFFISSAGGVVAQIWTFAVSQSMRGSFTYYKYLPELVTLFLSIVCIIKAKAIEAWLETRIEDDSQGHLQRPVDKTSPGA